MTVICCILLFMDLMDVADAFYLVIFGLFRQKKGKIDYGRGGSSVTAR
jgi:hypothetical protein